MMPSPIRRLYCGKPTIWLAPLCFYFLLGGCSGGSGPPSEALDLSGDLSAAGSDLATNSCSGCGANQVCNNGTCQDLPRSCPCPKESYCELASQTCVIGCLADEGCAAGRYCDTASRRCLDGCRGDAECGATKICTAHACVTGCRSSGQCPNITDTCENDRCVNRCPNCDDTNNCTADSCERGRCLHKADNEGGACPGPACAMDPHCSAGKCVSTPMDDGSSCGTEYQKCLAGQCKDVLVYCDNQTSGGFTYSDSSGMYSGFNISGSCFCSSSVKINATDNRPHSCTTCKLDPNKATRPICWK